jgi:hypothetical protein
MERKGVMDGIVRGIPKHSKRPVVDGIVCGIPRKAHLPLKEEINKVHPSSTRAAEGQFGGATLPQMKK